MSESGTEWTVDDVVEYATLQVETYAAKAQQYDGEKGAFFAGLRAAWAGVVEEFGDDDDFDEALRRGSEASNECYDDTGTDRAENNNEADENE